MQSKGELEGRESFSAHFVTTAKFFWAAASVSSGDKCGAVVSRGLNAAECWMVLDSA